MTENVANIEDEYADLIRIMYRCNEISVADALKHRFEQLVKLNDLANFLDKQLKEADWRVLDQNRLLGEKDKRIAELEALQEANDRAVLDYCSRITKLEAALKPFAEIEPIDTWPREKELVLAARAALESKKDRKSTRLNSSHIPLSRMPSSA